MKVSPEDTKASPDGDTNFLALRYPRYFFWFYLLGVAFFFYMTVSAFVTPESEGPGMLSGLFNSLGMTGQACLFAVLGVWCLANLPMVRRTYELSDTHLTERSPSGSVKAFKWGDIDQVRVSYFLHQIAVASSNGDRIRIRRNLPGSGIIRSFVTAASGLKNHGAQGNTLDELFSSLLDRKGEISYRMGEARSGFGRNSQQRKMIRFHTVGFDIIGETGSDVSVAWAEIAGLDYPSAKNWALTVKSDNDQVLAVILPDFTEFWAAAYFINLMRFR